MMKRTLFKIAAMAFAGLALVACASPQGASAPPEPVVYAAPAAKPPMSIVEMEFELRKLELTQQGLETMAIIKFADESKSEYAKGVVSGLLSGSRTKAADTGGRSSIMQAKAQQDEISLRREEIASRDSWWNRGLQVFDRGLGFAQFSKGLSQQRYLTDASNTQSRYLFDTLRSTQQDGYTFSTNIVDKGPYVLPEGAAPVSTSTAP